MAAMIPIAKAIQSVGSSFLNLPRDKDKKNVPIQSRTLANGRMVFQKSPDAAK
jgi:hypothetical protein